MAKTYTQPGMTTVLFGIYQFKNIGKIKTNTNSGWNYQSVPSLDQLKSQVNEIRPHLTTDETTEADTARQE